MLDALKSWLGAGGIPVEPETAERRAKICVECPLNAAPKWWEKMLTNPIAEAIRSMLEEKSKHHLSTFIDKVIRVCHLIECGPMQPAS